MWVNWAEIGQDGRPGWEERGVWLVEGEEEEVAGPVWGWGWWTGGVCFVPVKFQVPAHLSRDISVGAAIVGAREHVAGRALGLAGREALQMT